METVSVKFVGRWDWDCPKCGYHHEEDYDPADHETVACENCECVFRPNES